MKLSPVSAGARRLAAAWLVLGVLALGASGLFSVLIVLSRTPLLHQLIPWTDFFHTALVVHVDLSVLIWFLALAGVIWSLGSSAKLSILGGLSLWLCASGTLVMVVAPFIGEGHPLMNNYIPVLQTPVFMTGLLLVGLGFSLLVLRSLFAPEGIGFGSGVAVLRLGAYLAALAAGLALLALLGSWWQLGVLEAPLLPEGRAYYEYLFWGGGHVLQFTHTLLLLLAWLWLSQLCSARIPVSNILAGWLFVLAALPVVVTPLIYLQTDIVSPQHRIAFTELMRWGGLACLPLGLAVVWSLFATGLGQLKCGALRNALLASIALFAMGGVLAFMIDGINVVIPAHYHGSIVGVTLAFMGLSYHLLPELGFGQPMPRLSSWQPWVYGGGQFLHISGLAWSGGYGVERKTAGAAQGLENLPEIAGMAMMGLGGLIAIIGGIMFIVVALQAMLARK